MARTRILSPFFFSSRSLGRCSMPARLLFAGLWTLADREGRLEWIPKLIEGHIFPYDDGVDMSALIRELEGVGSVSCYTNGAGDRFVSIPSWSAWQRPHPREAQSRIPGPADPKVSLRSAQGSPKANPRQTSPAANANSGDVQQVSLGSTLGEPRARLDPSVSSSTSGSTSGSVSASRARTRERPETPSQLGTLALSASGRQRIWDVDTLARKLGVMGRGGVIANPLQSDRLLTILDASTDEEIGARLDRASDGHKPYSTFARLFDRSGRPRELYAHGGRSEKRMTDEEFEAALARPLGETA